MSDSTALEPTPRKPVGRAARYQRKAELYKAQLDATEKALAEAMPHGAAQIVAIMRGTYKYQVVNSKTGMIEELTPTPADVIKAFEVAANRILGKPISVKEVYQETQQTRRTLLIVGAAADIIRAERGEDTSGAIEASVSAGRDVPGERGDAATTSALPTTALPTTTTAPTTTPSLPLTTTTTTTTDYLPPTDSSSFSFSHLQPARPNSTNPARERRLLRKARKHQEEGR